MSVFDSVSTFFKSRYKDYESKLASIFYVLGWGVAITLLAFHCFGSFSFSSEALTLDELVWILSIPATFSSLGQYLGRASDGLFSKDKKANNERVASLVGVILAVGFVAAAIEFHCVDPSFIQESSNSISWEYLAYTTPIIANTIAAGCGYIGRAIDYFTKEKTILDLFRWVKAKITNKEVKDKGPFPDMPQPPPQLALNLRALGKITKSFFSGVGNFFRERFANKESRFRVLGLVAGITLGIVLIATGTALLPFSGGSSVVLHVAAGALFLFLSGRTFASVGKYTGKAADCLLGKKKPDNEQIASVVGIVIGLVVTVATIPLHYTGVGLILPRVAEKAWAAICVSSPILINNMASGCAYMGRFIDHITKKKSYINFFNWTIDKIFPKKQEVSAPLLVEEVEAKDSPRNQEGLDSATLLQSDDSAPKLKENIDGYREIGSPSVSEEFVTEIEDQSSYASLFSIMKRSEASTCLKGEMLAVNISQADEPAANSSLDKENVRDVYSNDTMVQCGIRLQQP